MTQYLPVKCKFESDLLFIYPTINGVEYECVFDTGNGLGILILQKSVTQNCIIEILLLFLYSDTMLFNILLNEVCNVIS